MNSSYTMALLSMMALAMTSNSAELDEAQIEQEAMRILDEFVRSTNARETEQHVAILHHPHYRLAHGTMTIDENEEELMETNAKFLPELLRQIGIVLSGSTGASFKLANQRYI